MNFKLAKVTLFALLLIINGETFSQEKVWIEGSWLLTLDPDNDTQDEIQFLTGGRFKTTEVSQSKSLDGRYSLEKESVKIDLFHEGQVFYTLTLTYDEKRDKLYYYSEETGNTSYYTRSN